MGIQINGQTDIISAIDGSLSIQGGDLGSASASSLNITGIVTAFGFSGNINSSGVSTITTLNATSLVGVSTIGVSTAYITTLSGISTISASANVSINQNLVFASGKGIDFSATANSSGTMTSELLNDYEEGTWTPIASASNGTITSYTSSGRYTKVGRTVTLHFIITITNQGTASGAYLNWSGAPYASANTFTMVGTCREQSINGFLSTAQINGNSTSGTVLRYDNSGVIVNGGNFSCTIVYEAA